MKELTDEVNQNDLTCYFKSNTFRKRFYDFSNGIELFQKMISSEIKLEEVKNLQNSFKSNLNEISKQMFRLKERKSPLKY